jgi:hypothetical protein
VLALMEKGQGPWFEMAEGNCESHPILRAPRICRAISFILCLQTHVSADPFPSTYITYSVGPGMIPLPAWPMRVACRKGLDTDFGVQFVGNRSDVRYTVSLGGLSVDVDWNVSRVSSAPHDAGLGGFSDASLRGEAEGLSALVRGVAEAVGVWYHLHNPRNSDAGNTSLHLTENCAF